MKDENKIKLRRPDFSDVPILSRLLNNKKIWDNLTNRVPYPYNESDAKNFINLINNDELQHVFAIEHNRNFCGLVGLTVQKDVYEKSAELGYWIGEPFWGKGIATKAVKLITEIGFNKLKLIRIYAGVFEFNIASMKVLERNGFIKEGIFKKAIFKNERILDEHRYYKLNQKEYNTTQ